MIIQQLDEPLLQVVGINGHTSQDSFLHWQLCGGLGEEQVQEALRCGLRFVVGQSRSFIDFDDEKIPQQALQLPIFGNPLSDVDRGYTLSESATPVGRAAGTNVMHRAPSVKIDRPTAGLSTMGCGQYFRAG